MNKKALLEYALFARKELETQIALSLNKLGIYKDHITKANVVGDFTIIEGTQETFPKRVYELRKSIVENEFHLKNQKFDNVVEEFAYTWFNRIVAIRFMEVHDYFPHGFRVLTSRDGAYEPEIMKNLPYVLEELDLKESVIRSLKEQNKTEELYRYVLFKQCNRLSKVFPDLFSKGEEYLELLLPNNLLSQDSIIRKLESIPEEDFLNDVEIVGWLYQFYNSVKKDEVFASKEVITKDTLPAVTQLFTPDWIVRYMAENSVGRLWLESYPNSSLRSDLKYYVDDAKQDDETNKKLEEIKYKNVDPEKIKVIEPCSGSGHILVYVFDLLFKMYLEKGYNSKDIPSLILKNNLYGLDIDKRAAQLAQFSLIMKARSIDNRFFNEDRFVRPRVFEIIDSKLLKETNYHESMKSLHFSEESIKMVDFLYDIFENAKIIGSLLKIPARDYSGLMDDIKRCRDLESPNLLEYSFYHAGIDCIKDLVKVAMTLSRKYDVMITNPPYCNTGNIELICKEYAIEKYPKSKTDMYAMFMDTDFVKKNGFLSMINMHAWMFLTSFTKLREQLTSDNLLINLLHLGPRAFEAISGEVVQTCSFVFRNTKSIPNYLTTFYRLVEIKSEEGKKNRFLDNNQNDIFFRKVSDLRKIPESPYSYWISQNVLDAYNSFPLIGDLIPVKKGADTGDNEKYVKYWFEVEFDQINVSSPDYKWVLYNKGGEFRKWYGNNFYVVWWKNNGYDLKHSKANLRSPHLYFRDSITWTTVGNCTYRYCPFKTIFDSSGSSMFPNNKEDSMYYLGILNTSSLDYFLSVKNSTLSNGAGTIALLPMIQNSINRNRIIDLATENYGYCKEEWDEYEMSFEFSKHPLINSNSKLLDVYDKFKSQRETQRLSLKKNEEELNEITSNEFKLNNEIQNTVEDKFLTIKPAEKEREIKSLISYFIGCIMGRYSLEQEGLVYAGGTFDASKYGDYVDADGVVPIYRFVGIEDGLTTGICNMVKRVYGDTYYKENLDFIAEALGRKPEEGAEEAINRYLNDGFYDDHVKIYQKRPIYWMLSSGKQGAFKCLVYLHRYNKNTLALINTKYFLPRTAMYKAERERLEFKLVNADIREKKKIEKELTVIEACEEELLEYGQVLDHMANQFIDIDLDDGVKVNYVKFQGVELEVNGARIKKNLLVPFGLEEKKK